METLLWTLLGLAILDSLNFFNVGLVLGIVFDSRLNRRSPLPAALSFLAGLFAATTVVGLLLVLGIDVMTDLVHVEITPQARYWAELVLGVVLVGVAMVPMSTGGSTPGWVLSAIRQRPWLLALVGVGFGLTQAPVSVSYLAAMAMLAAEDPRITFWPLIVAVYCVATLLPSLIALGLATRGTRAARRAQGRLVDGLAKWGPIAIRVLLFAIGVVLLVDVVRNHGELW